MLTQLLTIKKHREEGLLQEIAENRAQQAQGAQQEKVLLEQQAQNRQQWRLANLQSQHAPRFKLNTALGAYGQFYAEEQRLLGLILQNRRHQQTLEEALVALQAQVHTNRIEQEKLKYLIERQPHDKV